MSMEKNGAISSETPSCNGCGCKKTTKVARICSLPGQLPLFPETAGEADRLEDDLTKSAVDAVRTASQTPK